MGHCVLKGGQYKEKGTRKRNPGASSEATFPMNVLGERNQIQGASAQWAQISACRPAGHPGGVVKSSARCTKVWLRPLHTQAFQEIVEKKHDVWHNAS